LVAFFSFFIHESLLEYCNLRLKVCKILALFLVLCILEILHLNKIQEKLIWHIDITDEPPTFCLNDPDNCKPRELQGNQSRFGGFGAFPHGITVATFCFCTKHVTFIMVDVGFMTMI